MKSFSVLALGTMLSLPMAALANTPVPTADPLASEVIDIVESSLSRDFTVSADVDLSVTGEEYNYDDTYTEYDMLYSTDSLMVKKNGNAYHIDVAEENISVQADGTDTPTDMYPLDLSLSFSEEAILDFDTFQFAGRFDILNIDTGDNDSLRHVVEGITEFVELFESKWIVLDFEEIEAEFPELLSTIQEMKGDFEAEFGSSDLQEVYGMMRWGLSSALSSGYASVEKNNTQYSITLQDPYAENTDSQLVVVLNTTRGGNISSMEISGKMTEYDYWDEQSFYTIIPEISVSFQYHSPVITFPEITEDDWEATNLVEMYLEMMKDDILEEQAKNAYFENLEAFQGSAWDAVSFLNENGTESDILFVEAYIEQAKVMDRRIRKKDIQLVADWYSLGDDWMVDSIYRELTYSPYDDSEYRRYNQKYALEYMMRMIDDSQFEYGVYIPWDYYDTSTLKLQSRGDILILLAKMRKSEMMQ